MKVLNLPDELHTQVYLPETIDECRNISCTDCICLSHRQEGYPCRFNVYLSTHAARKIAEPDMLKGCVKGEAIPSDISGKVRLAKRWLKEAEDEASANSLKVLDLFTEINRNITKLGETQHKQLVIGSQSNTPLWFLPSIENANDDVDGRDHYHHCPEKDNKLARLHYVKEDKVYACPSCRRVFYLR